MSAAHWSADVAGVAVAVEAQNDRYAKCATARLGDLVTRRSPEITVRVGAAAPVPSPGATAQPLEGMLGYELDDVVWITAGRAAVRIEGAEVDVGGPLGDMFDEDTLDNLLQFGIAAAMATPRRLLLHGATIARGDDALLLVGRSGMGKSTLAGAALLGGWDLLGDDLALVATPELRVRAVHRPLMIPSEIAEGTSLRGEIEAGDRARLRLDADVLAPGTRRLVGIVTVDHGDEGSIEFLGPGNAVVLDDALAVPPFRPVMRRQLAAGGAVLGLPAVRLRHARAPDRRVARAQVLLTEGLARCREAVAQ